MSGWLARCRLRLAAILTVLGSFSRPGGLSVSSGRWSPTPPKDQPAVGLVEPSSEQSGGWQPVELIPRSGLGPHGGVVTGNLGQQLSPTDRGIRSSAFL